MHLACIVHALTHDAVMWVQARLGLQRFFNLEFMPAKVMKRLFELMDTSGDGTIRLDEFCRFFTVCATIAAMS